MAAYGPESYTTKKGKEIVLRNCTAKDVQPFLELRKHIATASQHTLQYVGQPQVSIEQMEIRWERYITDPVSLQLGAFEEQTLVGSLGFHPWNSGHPWIRHIGWFGMMVLPTHWGLGIGSHLLKCLDKHAKNSGITRIEAHVRTKNATAVELYRKAGYVQEGVRKNAAYIDGNYQDEYYIAKMIESDAKVEKVRPK